MSLFAQTNDTIFLNNIKSIKFCANNAPLNDAVAELGVNSLTLSFDDLDGDNKDYGYFVQYCTSDWKINEKVESGEYIDGYPNDRINNFRAASGTLTPYMHYDLTLPNQSTRFSKSGNYLLTVYDDYNSKSVAFQRRFVIYESLLGIAPILATGQADKIDTHQELDFKVNFKNLRLQNPMNDVQATILQNFRWDNLISGMKPNFVQSENLVYDYQDKIVFPAVNEYRYLDIRSTRFRSERVKNIVRGNDEWVFVLYTDADRRPTPYLFYADVNGKFIINNSDFGQDAESGTTADYVKAYFTLMEREDFELYDIYIVGGFSDWKIDEANKMQKVEDNNLYEATLTLKQGYYNYEYVLVPKVKSMETQTLEGDHYETENEYTILLYYHPFGARFDRVVGYNRFKTRQF